jgi:ammonium transporter, Amt family
MRNPAGPNGLLLGNAHQLLVQAIGVGVAGTLGFGGTESHRFSVFIINL